MLDFKKSIFIKVILIIVVLFVFTELLNYSNVPSPSHTFQLNQHVIIKEIPTTTTTTTTTSKTPVANINKFDLSAPLEPNSSYLNIMCKKSAEFRVSTTLCVHDLNLDVHVSGSIWRDGVWERHIIKPFTDYVFDNPDWLVLDVGAQIGQYSLFAAKMGRDVLCVEPFHENILRIHKAAYTEKISNKIILLKNAISNKRNEIKRLAPNQGNIGGQSLLDHKNEIYKKSDMPNDKYLVETILFDDVIEYLPKKTDGSEYKKAILKIDIEGFEPFAFQNASLLFDKIDIRVIFMEWGNLPKQHDNSNLIVQMIEFLTSRKYTAYGDNMKLSDKNWRSWPWDIFWLRE